MAKNKRYERGIALSFICDHPTTPASGDPVRIGGLTGVAIVDELADGTTSVDMEGVYDVRVDDDLGAGIAAGDPLYYHDTATGPDPSSSVNNNPAGANAFFGWARETVGAGLAATIEVILGRDVISGS